MSNIIYQGCTLGHAPSSRWHLRQLPMTRLLCMLEKILFAGLFIIYFNKQQYTENATAAYWLGEDYK